MKISVNQVPPEGMTQQASYDPAALDMDRPDVHLQEPFKAQAAITKVERELVVDVGIRAPVHLTCARCLTDFTSTLALNEIFSYQVKPTDIVDITEDIRQEIILAYPMIPLCRPECKGLCRVCGQDLNVAVCSHQPVG